MPVPFCPSKLSATVGICLFFSAGGLLAEEIPVNLTATPLIYKSEETAASVEPDAGGEGVRLSYNFENGGDSIRYIFVLSPPLDGPLSKIQVTAKGSMGSIFLMLRNSANRAVSYSFGPLTDELQTFTIDPAVPSSPKANDDAKAIEDPLKNICFFVMKKGGDPAGFIEISKVVVIKAN